MNYKVWLGISRTQGTSILWGERFSDIRGYHGVHFGANIPNHIGFYAWFALKSR